MTESPTRIFIVEDEILVALELRDMLTDLGYEIVGPCTRLREAEQVARAEIIDLALLDVNLGDGDTSEPVAEILRERGIPCVFTTAYEPKQINFIVSDELVLRKPIGTIDLLGALPSTSSDPT